MEVLENNLVLQLSGKGSGCSLPLTRAVQKEKGKRVAVHGRREGLGPKGKCGVSQREVGQKQAFSFDQECELQACLKVEKGG